MKYALLSVTFIFCTTLLIAQNLVISNEQTPGGCDGMVVLDESSVNTQYGYTWWQTAPNNNLISAIGTNPTDSLVGLCAGNYALQYFDSLYNIQNTDTLYHFFQIDSVSNCSNFYLSLSGNNETAAGACDGSINSVVGGATGSVTYNWSNGATTPDISNLCIGTYWLAVTDGASCTDSATLVVQTSGSSGMSVFVHTEDETTDGSCDGVAIVYSSGGVPPYSYSHSNGSTFAVDSLLCSGFYNVLVTDANGDSISLNYVIASPTSTLSYISSGDTTITDTLTTQPVENCTIDFTTVDTAYVNGAQNVGQDSVLVNWVVVDNSGSHQVNSTYPLPSSTNGVYAFELSLFCPQKASGNVFKVRLSYFVDENLSIETLGSLGTVNIYPNPSKDYINIESVEGESKLAYFIYDAKGTHVASGQLEQLSTKLDISSFDSGVYFVHVEGNLPMKIIKR